MEVEAKREATFLDSWPHVGTKLTPERLAAAGFYSAPVENAMDRCVCFACENALTHWDSTDDPWAEHKTWYPQCPFVQGKPTGNVPRKRGLVPKPPTPPAEAPDMSQGWGVGMVKEKAAVSTENAAGGGIAALVKATSGLGTYIQQLQKLEPAVVSTPRQSALGTSRPASVPALFPIGSQPPSTPPAEVSSDVVFRGRPEGKQKRGGKADKGGSKGDVSKRGSEPISPASQVLLSMWERAVSSDEADNRGRAVARDPSPNQQQQSLSRQQASPRADPSEPKPQQTASGPNEWELANTVYDEAPRGGGVGGLGGGSVVGGPLVVSAPKTPRGTRRRKADVVMQSMREEWEREKVEHEKLVLEWANEEEGIKRRIEELKTVEAHAAGASKVFGTVRDMVQEACKAVEKAQEGVVKDAVGRMVDYEARISKCGVHLQAAKGRVEGLRDSVVAQRKEKGRLDAEVERRKTDFDRLVRVDVEVRAATEDLERCRAECSGLQHASEELRVDISQLVVRQTELSVSIGEQEQAVEERMHEVRVQEERLRGLDERQALLLSGEQDLAERAASLCDRENKWKAREEWIARREGELKGLEAVLLARERKLREMESYNDPQRASAPGVMPSPRPSPGGLGRRPSFSPAQMSMAAAAGGHSPSHNGGSPFPGGVLQSPRKGARGPPMYQHMNAW